MPPTYEEADIFAQNDRNISRIMNASPFGVMVFNEHERIVYANSLAEALFGVKMTEPDRLRCGDFIDCFNCFETPRGCGFAPVCQDCAVYRAVRSALSATPDPLVCAGESLIHREDEEDDIWIKFTATDIKINGRAFAVMGIDDITAQKKDHERLKSALAELTVIHEHAPIAMLLVDRDRRVRKVNGHAALFAGRKADEMIGMPGGEALRCLHHLDDPQGCGFGPSCSECRIRRVVLETFETRKSFHELESWLPFPRDNSVEKRCLLVSTAYLNIDETERVLVCVQDATERKKAEDLAQASRQRLESIFRAAPVGIGVVNDRIIMEVNDRLCEMTGFEADELIGQSARILYPTDEDYENVGREKYAQISASGMGMVETRWRCRDGRILDIFLASTSMDKKDISKDITFTALDISERKRAEEKHRLLESQYHQSQKLESVGRLAGGVAHDFNNLLSVIMGYGEMVTDELSNNHPHHELMMEIQQAASRARDLVRQLLAFSRKQVLEIQTVDINHVVTGFKKLLHRIIGEDIRLKVILAEHPIPVRADTSQLEQVLLNMAVNARDAMPDGGQLAIETLTAASAGPLSGEDTQLTGNHWAVIRVSDTGCGMDTEIQDRLFEPFFTTKDKEKGTGLGLATSYGIIKQHGGHIQVASESGQGTTFYIHLPISWEKTEQTVAPAPERTSNRGSATVMVIEDDLAVRKLTVDILMRNGYQVIEAQSATGAVSLAADYHHPIHLVLSDVVMPGLRGPEAWQQISRHHPEAKVLYMSGYADDMIVHHGISNKEVDFIRKPFTSKVLLEKVWSMLSKESP